MSPDIRSKRLARMLALVGALLPISCERGEETEPPEQRSQPSLPEQAKQTSLPEQTEQIRQHKQPAQAKLPTPLPLPPPTVVTPESPLSLQVRLQQKNLLQDQLDDLGCPWGSPVFLQIFKHENQLELWVKPAHKSGFVLFKTYPVLGRSGRLGPKLKEGDRQAPEGIYAVGPGQLNPNSRYHLSFDLGFPNEFDRANGRTGSFLMVHGNTGSIGCYAMGDPAVEEIYTLVDEALRHGQGQVAVHCHPFRHDSAYAGALYESHGEWQPFWDQMRAAWQTFEDTRTPPAVKVRDGRYAVVTTADD